MSEIAHYMEAVAALKADNARLREALTEIHQPTDEEVECWSDGGGDQPDEHAKRYPHCADCHGHSYTIQVCRECGYTHDGDYPAYRGWPCPTIEALAATQAKP